MTPDKSVGQNRIREALARIYDGQPPYFREYLRRYKEDPKSRVFAPLAEAYRRIGKVDEAIAICLEGLQHHPEFTGGRVALAKCYLEKRRFQEARLELERVIEQAPENLLAQRLLGDTCLQLEDRESALHAYKMALLLSPSDVSLAQKVRALETQAAALPKPPPVELDAPGADEALEALEKEAAGETEPGTKPEDALELQPIAEPEQPLAPELVPVLSAEGKIEMIPFTEDKQLSSVERLLGVQETDIEDEAFRVEHVSQVFEEKASPSEITTETLGDLYLAQGQFDRALRIFEKIRESRPSESLERKIESTREKLGVSRDQMSREKKIELLQGVLERMQGMKPR